MLKDNIPFVEIQNDNVENPSRRVLCKFSDVFGFMKQNGVLEPKLAYVRDWLTTLGHVIYVEQTKAGLREIRNPEEQPAVRYCKGKNTAYTTPTGVYLMLTKLSLAENCLHRDFSLRMLREIYARCVPLVPELYLNPSTLTYMQQITLCPPKKFQYRIANARDYFGLPPFGENLNDNEIAALVVLGHPYEATKQSLLAKAAKADLAGFVLEETNSQTKPFPLPEASSDLDLSWMD